LVGFAVASEIYRVDHPAPLLALEQVFLAVKNLGLPDGQVA
jgi:hypothetical protein